MQGRNRVVARLARSFLLTTLAFAAIGLAVDTTASDTDALWVAQADSLVKVAPRDGTPQLSVSLGATVEALAVEPETGDVWAYAGGELQAIGPDGVRTATLAVSGLVPGQPVQLAVDGRSGTVWVASGKSLRLYFMGGSLVATRDLKTPIVDVALDRAHSHLWVGTGHAVTAFDAAGTSLFSYDLGTSATVHDLAYDPSLDETWVSADGGLYRFTDAGALSVARSLPRDGSFDRIVSDGHGGLWGTDGHTTVHAIADGSVDATVGSVAQASGKGRADSLIVDLTADPLDRSAWVATSTAVHQYAADGSALGTVTLDGSGGIRRIARLDLYADLTPPTLQITAPTAGAYLGNAHPTVTLSYLDIGSGVDLTSAEWQLDGAPATLTCTGDEESASCSFAAALTDGAHTLSVTIADAAGNRSQAAEVSFTVDTTPPVVTVSAPTDGSVTNQAQLTITGSVSEQATLTLDGLPVAVAGDLSFATARSLDEGTHSFAFVATDRAGNTGQRSVTVTLDTVAPAAVIASSVTVGDFQDGSVTLTGAPGSAEPGSTLVVRNTRTGATATVTVAADGSFVAQVGGASGDVLEVSLRDAAGNESPATQFQTSDLPPDPSSVAPPLTTAEVTLFSDRVSFLYSGSDPIQTGLQAGVLDPLRTAVVRGRVLDRAGAPVSGVRVRINGQPAYGETVTRADGGYDLAVNGGGRMTVDFSADDRLPVQRTIDVPWQDFALVDDVVMIQPDPVATPIQFGSATMQVAHSSVQDDNAPREAVVLFPAGTQASMVMPDGSTQPLANGTFRATEFTVGANGPDAMPGNLPDASGYTYAVDLSFDEARAAGAEHVQFDRKVPVYVDDFLGFPAGIIVPSGWYDSHGAQWVPADNGLVIKILAIGADGRAQLDVTGSGTAATAAQLAALGIDDAELSALGSLYPAGHSLWRTTPDRFSIWDSNWPYALLDFLVPPDNGAKKCDCQNTASGSIIETVSQVLGEDVPLAGMPVSLAYRSDRRVAGQGKRTIRVNMTDARPTGNLARVTAQVRIAGQLLVDEEFGAPNVSHNFDWNMKDAYGRFVVGSAEATVTIIYAYPAVYSGASGGSTQARMFDRAAAGGVTLNPVETGGSNTRFITVSRSYTIDVPGAFPDGATIGGWSVSGLHFYDRVQRTLYRGDGPRENTGDVLNVVETLAGGGTSSSVGIPATQGSLSSILDVETSADGMVFYLQTNWVRYVDRNGILHHLRTVTGATDMAFEPDGSLVVATRHQLFHLTRSGTLTVLAGTGDSAYAGDDGPASAAKIYLGNYVTVGRDGTIYFTDVKPGLVDETRIRMITPDGTVHLFTNAGPSTGAWHIDAAPDGSIYMAGGATHLVYRFTPDGHRKNFAGVNYGVSATPNVSGDGGPATSAHLAFPANVRVAADGSVYITDASTSDYVRVVTPAGTIYTYAGNGVASGSIGDGNTALDARFGDLRPGIAFGPDGTAYVGDNGNARIRRISPIVPGVDLAESAIPSGDGSEIYVFDAKGKHLRTLDAITGAVRMSFDYDTAGRVIAMHDVDGDTTTIVRDASGHATAVTDQDGHSATLVTASNGAMTSLTDGAGTRAFDYDSDGLLKTYTDARQHASHFTYDGAQRLKTDENAAGGSWTLDRSEHDRGYAVTMTSAEGRTQRHDSTTIALDDLLLTDTAEDGTIESFLRSKSGLTTRTSADGTVTTSQAKPDPRFGLTAPVASTSTVKSPSGLTMTTTETRSVTLSDPADVTSVSSVVDTTKVNGRSYTSSYAGATGTWTATSPVGRVSTVQIDAQGRPVMAQFGGLAAASYGYDYRGRLETVTVGSGADARTTRFSYFPVGLQAGWLASVTDAENRTVRFEYDAAGRVILQTLPDLRVIGYRYDANGNLVGLTPPGKPEHAFAFTVQDLEGEYTPPDVNPGEDKTVYGYDRDKLLRSITRPDGQVVGFDYGSDGKLDALTTPSGTYAYAYNGGTGQLATVSAPGGQTLGYSYDGMLLTQVQSTGTVTGTVAFGYDSDFRVNSLTVNGSSIAFGYDNDSLLTSAGAETLTRSTQNGLLTATTLGSVTTSHAYSTFGELSTEEAKFGATSLFKEQFTQRDKLGRIVAKTETVQGVAHSYVYGYDLAGRLTTVDKDGVRISTYGYDSNGNRLSRNSTVGTYDDQDRMLSYGAATYAYTANGELTSKTDGSGTTSYSYDVLGNLRSATLPNGTQLEYLIDGQNRRIGKKVNGTLVQGLLYQDQLEPVAELDGSGAVLARFVYASKAHVPDYMVKGGVTYRIVSDYLGSVRLVVDTSTGAVVQKMEYDEFGVVTQDTNPGFQPFGFAGGILDRDIGFVRFGARDYDPQTGRWTAKDPIGLRGGINVYAYAENDPVNLIDPTGLWSWGDPLPQGVVDAATGFGDGVFEAITLGIGDLGEIRNAFGIDGGVNECSRLYNGGKYAGYAWGAAIGVAGAARGARALGPGGRIIGHPAYGGRTINGLRSGRLRFGWSRNNGPTLRLGVGNRHFDIFPR